MKWKNYGEESRAVPERGDVSPATTTAKPPPPCSTSPTITPPQSVSPKTTHSLRRKPFLSLLGIPLSLSPPPHCPLSPHSRPLLHNFLSLSPPQLTTLTPFPSLGDLICWFSAPFFSGKGKKKEDKNERKWNLKMLCMANDEKESGVKLFIRVLIWAVRKCLKV